MPASRSVSFPESSEKNRLCPGNAVHTPHSGTLTVAAAHGAEGCALAQLEAGHTVYVSDAPQPLPVRRSAGTPCQQTTSLLAGYEKGQITPRHFSTGASPAQRQADSSPRVPGLEGCALAQSEPSYMLQVPGALRPLAACCRAGTPCQQIDSLPEGCAGGVCVLSNLARVMQALHSGMLTVAAAHVA